jgi:prophage DNA circulation protein
LVTTLRDNAAAAIRGNTLGTSLQAIFNAADAAGAQYAGIEAARKYLMAQSASTSIFTQAVMQNALVMTLAEECKIVSRTTFATQTETQNMILHMRDAFESARALGIEEIDIAYYQSITAMGGAMINHLATVELQLPRFMTYRAGAPMPSLYLAQRIYADPSRADELEAENGVIHPAFMPTVLRVLSLPPVGRTSF